MSKSRAHRSFLHIPYIDGEREQEKKISPPLLLRPFDWGHHVELTGHSAAAAAAATATAPAAAAAAAAWHVPSFFGVTHSSLAGGGGAAALVAAGPRHRQPWRHSPVVYSRHIADDRTCECLSAPRPCLFGHAFGTVGDGQTSRQRVN